MSIFNISRTKKQVLLILCDIFCSTLSLWLAFTLRLGELFWPNQSQTYLFILGTVLALPIFIRFGLYRAIIRYIGHKAMLAIIQAVTVLVLLWLILVVTLFPLYIGVEEHWFPRSIPILYWMILLLTVGGSRQGIRWLLSSRRSSISTSSQKNVLIYGAGRTGLELASSLAHNSDIQLLGFIDDDLTLYGYFVQNLQVLGDRTQIEKIRVKTNSLEILLAIPNMNQDERKALLKYLETKRVTVRTIPSLDDITSRVATMNELRDVDVSDLLPRKVVTPNQKLLAACITNKRVLVTGAGGSIGSELCRQILTLNPILVVLFEHSELNLYKINTELTSLCKNINCNVKIIPILGSITNKQRIEDIIKKFEIGTIYHAAAYKHVSLIEENIEEGVLNNIFGTYNVALAAHDLQVDNFILISTDKAVHPTSVMGATKRISELIIQGIAQKSKSECIDGKKVTHMVIVRFGNVLGSSGSVIPLFQKQISSGGPLTITHPEATRYFMTIPEASQLVLQAGSIDLSGKCSIFALDMGEPISILSLAKQLVYLSGHMLKTDDSNTGESSIEIKYTGLQKGEKIHEELFIGDNITSTEHPMILKAQETFCGWEKIEEILNQLKQNKISSKKIRQLLFQYTKD
ncbi:polysaccharide biosynthesis protein [Nitrospinae bacterium]|nr:polysaccharide biosynthesis protein [Nitrospinota bacterium]